MKRYLLCSIILATLSGCASLNHDRSAKKPHSIAEKSEAESISDWWAVFNDPLMNKLADNLLKQNLDIQIAQTRIEEARGILKTTRSDLFPSIDLTGVAQRGHTNTFATKPLSIANGGFNATWELDIFSNTKGKISASEARLKSRIASMKDIKNIMLADLMRSIIEWRKAQEIIRETKALLSTQDNQIALFESRSRAGLIDSTFLSRALAERSQTAACIPIARASHDAARFKIARLLATPEDQLFFEVNDRNSFSIPKMSEVASISVDMLRVRPDLQALRAEMLAAQSDLAKAEADLWPRLSVGAFFGVRDVSNGPATTDNPIWTLSSSIISPILNFGRLRGAVDVANAKSHAASLNYENCVLSALQETQTALSDYLNGINAASEQKKTLKFREDTVLFATKRFNQGLTDMTDLTTAQSELNQATITLIERRADAAIAYIRFQKALGIAFKGPV